MERSRRAFSSSVAGWDPDLTAEVQRVRGAHTRGQQPAAGYDYGEHAIRVTHVGDGSGDLRVTVARIERVLVIGRDGSVRVVEDDE